MSRIPGMGIARGMSITLRRFFQPAVTIRYPEIAAPIPPKNRGRLQLLYDENGSVKCETCFQCAQACPIECIDMGGTDTRGRYHIHWGPAETYGERREESALRRSGRPVADPAAEPFAPIDLAPLDAILARHDHDPAELLAILEETQETYGHLPVAALKHLSFRTAAPYALVYGTATYYRQFRLAPPADAAQAAAVAARRPSDASFLAALDASLGTGPRGTGTGAGPA